MERLRIGQILLRNSRLSERQLEEALKLQQARGGVLGEILLSSQLINSSDLFNALSMQIDMLFFRCGVPSVISEPNLSEKENSLKTFQKKVEKISLLLKTYSVIFSEKNFSVLLDILAQEAPIILDAERSALFLYDEKNDELWSKVAIGLNGKEIRFSARKGIAGYVLNTGKDLNIPDAYLDPRFNQEIDKQTGYRTHSILCVPLRNLSNKIIGVFEVINKKNGIFSREDEAILSMLSSQAAVAIENTQLFQELKNTKETLFKENLILKEKLRQKNSFEEIIGTGKRITQTVSIARKVAGSTANVLILGESGTGKELFARAIHNNSDRWQNAFVALNCAAIPESLLESELFGIEKGVATGVEKRVGKFEMADGGTIFLDEIGDMNYALQAKVLRVIQERELERVGGNKTIKLDIRIIAATNKNLQEEIGNKRFREDLYYRLNVISLELPPLRERGEDIILLATYFLERKSGKYGKVAHSFSLEAKGCLENYLWPGNVRELENEIERVVILADPDIKEISGDLISPKLKYEYGQNFMEKESPDDVLLNKFDLKKRETILSALKRNDNNKTYAAKELGISRQSLQKMIRRLAL